MAGPKVCIDRIAPRDDTRAPLSVPILRSSGERTRAIVPDARMMWPNGITLGVRFLEGTDAQQGMVRDYAVQWSDHANVAFEFIDDVDAHIRIGFDTSDGAWSYVGDRALDFPANRKTMNLGWVDEAVILHEFGHALGLGHEHQNPQGSAIEWNEDAVIRDASGPPNNWDAATIRRNILERYEVDHHLRGTEFDPDSIMLYFFPDEWVRSGSGTKQNLVMSELDKQFIGSREAYPGGVPASTTLEVGRVSASHGVIGAPGEEDTYRFEVESEGLYVVETGGETDLVLGLYGPGESANKIAEDDDSGSGHNARIAARLSPGTYRAQVRHYNQRAGTGEYTVHVTRID